MTPAPSTAVAAGSDAPAVELKVFTSPTRPIGGDPRRTFSPITSSLILGEREAVLVDSDSAP